MKIHTSEPLFSHKQILLRWLDRHCFSYCSFFFQRPKKITDWQWEVTIMLKEHSYGWFNYLEFDMSLNRQRH